MKGVIWEGWGATASIIIAKVNDSIVVFTPTFSKSPPKNVYSDPVNRRVEVWDSSNQARGISHGDKMSVRHCRNQTNWGQEIMEDKWMERVGERRGGVFSTFILRTVVSCLWNRWSDWHTDRLTAWSADWTNRMNHLLAEWRNKMTDSLDMWADSTHSSPLRVSASIMRSSRTKAASAQRSVSIVMQSTRKQQKPRVLSPQLCEQMPRVQLEKARQGLTFPVWL